MGQVRRRLTNGGLLAAAVATILLLCARVLVGRPLARRAAAGDGWMEETAQQATERRLAACEANLANVWEVLNGRDAQHR